MAEELPYESRSVRADAAARRIVSSMRASRVAGRLALAIHHKGSTARSPAGVIRPCSTSRATRLFVVQNQPDIWTRVVVLREPLAPPSPIGRFKLLTLCDDHGDSSYSHPRPRGTFLSPVCWFNGQRLIGEYAVSPAAGKIR
ncbi:MAG TPA: hypothetical protein VIL87_17375 [Dermatophilaceae bacterium]|jgi:hypothetical protein